MKAQRGQVERALDRPDPAIRLFLLHGPDESASRSLVARLAARLGNDAERVDLGSAQLKGDPALLADEAASIALFGGPRYILVDGAGDEVVPAVRALLDAGSAGNPALIIAGQLRKESALLKLALADPAILALASYLPEGADADRLAQGLARDAGLRMRPDVAHRLAEATGGDRALLAGEIEKLALYADAAPDRPGDIDHDTLDALGADSESGDLSRLVDAVLGGLPGDADGELIRLDAVGIEGIPVIRALLRRLLLLAELRAEIDRGNSVSTAMASSARGLFWKDKDAVTGQVMRLGSPLLATMIDRLAEAERQIKANHLAGPTAAAELMIGLSRAAARAR